MWRTLPETEVKVEEREMGESKMLDDYKRVMVTGGAGFIGSHLCEEILALGKHVVVADDLSTGKKENLPPGVEFVQMDISEPGRLSTALEDVDIIFHVAAQPSTRRSIEHPHLDFRCNALGTYNALAAARRAGVSRLIYTSSSAVYGQPGRLPLCEGDLPMPMTPYGASKLCGEHYCSAFAGVFGLRCTTLRPFNVYGPRENLKTSLDEVVQYAVAIMEDRPLTVYGDGSQTRDFVYVKDVVRAHVLAADREESVGKVLNVGTGVETSINDLVRTMERVADKRAEVQHGPWPEGDILREYGDMSTVGKIIGYAPETDLAEGIRQLMWEKSRGSPRPH